MTEVEDLRAVIREAHEVIKDLRAVVKEGKTMLADLELAAQVAVDDRIGESIRTGLEQFHEANMNAIAESEAAIYSRFATIGDVLMGEDRDSKRAGSAIKTMAQEWAAQNG